MQETLKTTTGLSRLMSWMGDTYRPRQTRLG